MPEIGAAAAGFADSGVAPPLLPLPRAATGVRDVERRGVEVLGALAAELLLGVEAAAAGVLATGVTSTVLLAALLAAAELRVVRRRGVGEGVAMENVGGSGTEAEERGGSLSVRRPVVDDSTDRQIGEHRVVRARMPGG